MVPFGRRPGWIALGGELIGNLVSIAHQMIWRTCTRFLWALVLIGLAGYAFYFLRFAAVLTTHPFDWEESDGNVLVVGRLLGAGRSIYNDPYSFPMMPYVYPPLYPTVVFVLTRLFGESVGVARFVSLLATVGLVFLIYRIVRGAGVSRTMSVVASFLLFTFPQGSRWLVSGRPDSLLCLLLVAGFHSLRWAGARDGTHFRLIVPLVLFLLAGFTKQPGFLAAVMAAVALGAMNFQRGAIFLVVFALASLAVGLCLQSWSGGWFYCDVFEYAVAVAKRWPIRPDRLRLFFSIFLKSFLIPLIIALAVTVRFIKHRKRLPWVLFLGVTFVWSLQVGRNGAGTNHFIPVAAAICICFGTVAGIYLRWWRRRGIRKGCLAEIILACLLLGQFIFPWKELRYFNPPKKTDQLAWQEVVDFMKKTPGPVLVDYAPAAAVASGKWEFFSDSSSTFFGGAAVERVLVPLIAQRHFAALVLYYHTFFPDEVKAAIENHFELVNIKPIRTSEVDQKRYLLLLVPNEGGHENKSNP